MHGLRVYRDITGSEFNVFVSESEDDGSVFRHEFWEPFFDKTNVCRHIYQAFVESCLELNISPADIKDAMSPVQPRLSEPTKFDHDAMRPYFGWIPVDRIVKTIRATTQLMRMPSSTYLRKRLRTPHPAANIIRRREVDYTDVVHFDTPAVDTGETSAALYYGGNTKLNSVHGLKNLEEPEVLGSFQDWVRWHGAPEQLAADNAPVYRGNLFTKYLRDLYIRLWQCESYHQNQNKQERGWQQLKYGTNRLLDFSGAPRNFALLALIFYAFILNHTVDASVGSGDMSPYMMATGQSDDISALMCFRFNEPVYCLVDSDHQQFPSKPKEVRARWVGVSENVGGPMTWKVVTEKTQKVLCQSAIRTALDPSMRNLSLDPLKSTDFKMLPSSPTDKPTTAPSSPPNPDSYEETPDKEVVYFRDDGEKSDGTTSHKFKSVITDANGEPKRDENGEIMYRVGPHPEELPGMNFRMPDPDTGLPTHITIGKLIDDYDDGLRKNKVRQAHFEVKDNKDDKDNIMSYNDIVEFLSRDTSLYDGEYWHFRKIIGHKETP